MGYSSGIEWTDDTFNPWWGCTRVSPACDNCYAETFAHRMKFEVWGHSGQRRFFGDKHWNEPLKWNRLAQQAGVPRRCFCASMCDIMEQHGVAKINAEMDACRARLYDLVGVTDWLIWLLLTKRPQEFRKKLPAAWLRKPRNNVWLMATVENADYLWRVRELLAVPAVVHGLSLEPLMGRIDLPKEFLDRGNKAWAIVGGESGGPVRPMQIAWVRWVRDQCLEAGVPFFMKQWGEFNGSLVRLGAAHTGCAVDGIEWKQVPELLAA